MFDVCFIYILEFPNLTQQNAFSFIIRFAGMCFEVPGYLTSSISLC